MGLALFAGRDLGQGGDGQAAADGAQDTPPPAGRLRPSLGHQGRDLPGPGQPPAHVDGRGRAIGQAVHAEPRIRTSGNPCRGRRNRCSGWRRRCTCVQSSIDRQAQKRVLGQPAVQGAQRAQDIAEKAAAAEIQQQQAEKDPPMTKACRKVRCSPLSRKLRLRSYNGLTPCRPGCRCRRRLPGPAGSGNSVPGRRTVAPLRVSSEKGSSQPSHWVANSEASSRTISSRYFQRRDPWLRSALSPFAPRAQPGEKLLQGAERADPAAEKTAEDQGQQQRQQGQQKGADERAGQDIHPEIQRVDIEEKAGMRQQVLDGDPGAPDQQEEEQDQEQKLAGDAQPLPAFLLFGRSPDF